MKPHGQLIGVSESEIDIPEVPDEPDNTEDNDTDIADGTHLSDYIQSKTITIEGKEVYKATVVKQMYSSQPLSKDRLRRVQGLTRSSNQLDDTFVDNMVYVGDPVLIKPQTGNVYIANINTLTVAQKIAQLVSASLIGNDGSVILEVRELNLVSCEEAPEKLFWDGNFKTDTYETINAMYLCML